MTTNEELKPEERLLRLALIVLAFVFAGFIVAYLIDGLNGGGKFPFVANSVTKDGLFLALALIAIADLRRFGWLTLLVILGHVLLIVTLGLMLLTGNAGDAGLLPGGSAENGEGSAAIWLGADVFVVALLSVLYTSAGRARNRLGYLSSPEFDTVAALSEVLIKSDKRKLSPEEIGHKVDDYLHNFKAASKGKVRFLLIFLTVYPVLTGHLPFPAMAPESRARFVKRRFMTEGSWVLGRMWRRAMQLMIAAAAQLVYLGYYGDSRTFKSVGYKPFEDRKDYKEKMRRVQPERPRVKTHTPGEIDCSMTADVVIVGSGAAGAILAYEFAAREKSVLVLERGAHVDPTKFTANEPEMLAKLYVDGALQLSRDLRFAVLQGMCVGGTTVVNNAICFDLPDDVLHRWNDSECLNAGLDEPELRDSFLHVRQWLAINRQPQTKTPPPVQVFTGAAEKLKRGAAIVNSARPVTAIEANIVDCLGCGYCNIGCKYGKKLSMLDTVLPWAQEDFGDQVRIVSECRAERIETDGRRARSVVCRLGDGREFRAHAKERVIVSAGAINSSLLLQRSGLGGPLVGKHASFNMVSPLTAHFPEGLDPPPYDGMQMSHYLEPSAGDGFVLETWFNPPAMQSLFMPGWFEDHFDNMARYDHMACAGVVVGTRRNGEVRRKRLRGDFAFEPQKDDVAKLVGGVKHLGRIFLAAGAEKVMPSTFRFHEIRSENQLAELNRYIDDRRGMSLNSSHPQGGNAISKDARMGVVNEEFCIHGMDNVHVCDASVFPTSITVNPQLTVMALAHYAARKIGGDAPGAAATSALHAASGRIAALTPDVSKAEPEAAPVEQANGPAPELHPETVGARERPIEPGD